MTWAGTSGSGDGNIFTSQLQGKQIKKGRTVFLFLSVFLVVLSRIPRTELPIVIKTDAGIETFTNPIRHFAMAFFLVTSKSAPGFVDMLQFHLKP